MFGIHNNGYFTEISIMDIYSVIYDYDKSGKFGDLNDLDQFQTQIHNITNHYDKTNKIEIIYKNYKNYINNITDLKFKYNINHYVEFKGKNTDFILSQQYSIIAYSDKYVINLKLTPQFNKLNFYQIIVQSMLEHYLLLNTTDKDNHRFKDKEIHTCIISLDSENPVFYKFDDIILVNEFKVIIKEFLYKKYCIYHLSIYKKYKYCNDNKLGGKSGGLQYFIDKFNDLIKESPIYIIDYLKFLKNNPKEEIKKILDSEEIFISSLNSALEKSINNFIGDNEEEIDY